MLADILKENNVNNEGMRFDPGARTALAFVTLRKDGEREFMFYRNPSADMLLQEDELDFDLIRKVCKYFFSITNSQVKANGVVVKQRDEEINKYLLNETITERRVVHRISFDSSILMVLVLLFV